MTDGFYYPTDASGHPLNIVYAEDIAQILNVLTGQRDGGPLSLLAPLAAPAAPAVTKSSGGVTGSGYQWAVYWITGNLDGTGAAHVTGRTPYGTLTGAQALTAQQATVSIAGLGSPPTGAIGWGVARNKSGGATWYEVPNSEQFMSLAGTMPATFVDNAADASLVTTAPTANTTGTTLGFSLVALGTGTSTVSTGGTTFGTGADLLASDLSFHADGTSAYALLVASSGLSNTTAGTANKISANLDGSDAGVALFATQPASSANYDVNALALGYLGVLSSGQHTLNARAWVTSGTVSVGGAAGGPGTSLPLLVAAVKLS